jgi:ubiquinone/menaquinone biosynthesis C-methylase UbiE
MERIPDARLVTLHDYAILGWSDLVAERTDEISSAMLNFLAQHTPPGGAKTVPATEEQGEIAGISYRMRGAGPPLVLLPLFLAPSQWEPLVPRLSAQYCTITLGGRELGAVAILESRGRARGYVRMVRTLIDTMQVQPGETIVEVGCGTGVLDRWLAQYTGGANPIIGVDINRYLLHEAIVLAQQEGCTGTIEFREGSAEALPFADNSVDVTMSVTVIEEVDANQMLAEMVRVTKPGGRVGIIARAMDSPFLMNLQLRGALKAKAEAAGVIGNVEEKGCADASLYQRLHQVGLTQIQMVPQFAAFDSADTHIGQFMQDVLLAKLHPDEAREWQTARDQAEAAGTFFMAWPHHCAVGTKPS